MLFVSPLFLFLFLPAVLAGYAVLRRWGGDRAVVFGLIAASMAFYARWSPWFLLLLLASTAVNFAAGRVLDALPPGGRRRRAVLAAGVAFNLAVLGWFKYRGFFLENWNAAFGTRFDWGAVVLPLGISFFSFQKIAYLVDVAKGVRAERNFANYLLYVLFFPQLIAGPIVHPSEFLPQERTAWRGPADWENIRRGALYFALGMGKKVLLADPIAQLVDKSFAWAGHGGAIGAAEAWTVAFGYAFQLYFDFSGYSDMAIGLALLLNIRLPFNFDAPYRAASIQEFWQRWHMTLSRFIRDYLYIPLGGSRGGLGCHYRNLLLTMLLAGVWHGAGWTFVLWGGLHGLYLVLHDAWRRRSPRPDRRPAWGAPATFLAVTLAWILFRADSLRTAGAFYAAMAGTHGLGHPRGNIVGWLLLGGAIAFAAPTARQWVEGERRAGWAGRLVPLPLHPLAAFLIALLLFGCLLQIIAQPPSDFIYFNF